MERSAQEQSAVKHLVQTIQADLPKMPAEVVEIWLAPQTLRAGFGWPPPEDGRAEPWSVVLAARPLSWWAEQIWVVDHLPFETDTLSHAAQLTLHELIKAAHAGRDMLPDSVARIARVTEYMRAHGTWPRPVIAYPASDGLALADGYHRLAALQMAQEDGLPGLAARHAVWIALPD